MRVAIDIRRVMDYGAGTYTRNLIATLARLEPDDASYVLVGSGAARDALGDLPQNFSLLEFDRGHDGLRHDLRLHRSLRRAGADLFHTPYLSAPWLLPCPHIITVHDMVDFLSRTADGGSLAELLEFQRTRWGLHRAARVLTVSRHTQRDVERIFGIAPEKITVVYNALDARLEVPLAPEEIERTLSRYSVRDPYLLYAGNVKPHKNVPRLIEAFSLVKDELREHPRYKNLRLIIIGEELSQHPQLRRSVIQSRMQNDVRFLGFVPPPTLSAFYVRAEAFVFPSLHEGFGLPPLEAMSLGTPVVTSNVSALPEVLGEAAFFVNPEKVFDISRGISQVLLEDDLRRELIERGREHVRRFSWRESVQRILAIYRDVAGR